MDIGMLWFDNDLKADISTKIVKAASYYRQKYGKSPTLCFIHPSMLPEASPENGSTNLKSGNILVRTSTRVMPNHFWIGVNGVAKLEQ